MECSSYPAEAMATDFYPSPRPLPESLTHARFVLEPLTAEHVERDYQAVMASREMLRRWSGTTWPADDFTLAGNLEDLEMHDGEHRRREAFTYTVLSPDRSTCLGCVYITPLSVHAEENPGLEAGPHDAVVGFWVASTPSGNGLDRLLLDELRRWLAEDWDFESVSFAVRPALAEQVDLLRTAGLAEHRRIFVQARQSDFILFR